MPICPADLDWSKLQVMGHLLELDIGMMKWKNMLSGSVYCDYFFMERGLEDTIKLVPFSMRDCPACYKEKAFPENKVSV